MKTQLSGHLSVKCIGFPSFCLTWPFGWPRDQIAQRPPNVKNFKNINENTVFWRLDVKNVKNVNENTAFWRFRVKNVKNVDENTAFWQVDYELYWFS